MRLVLAATLRTLWTRQDGQDLIEYALIGGFLAVLAAVSIPSAADALNHLFGLIVGDLNAVASSITTS